VREDPTRTLNPENDRWKGAEGHISEGQQFPHRADSG